MHSTITTSALAQCITHLERLLQDNSPGAAKNEWEICRLGLKAIMNKLDSYREKIVTTECFLRFFSENIERLLICMAKLQTEDDDALVAKFEDLMFAINEEMAVLMREHVLRTGFSDLSEEERHVLDFFETSGLWFLGDGTMVSEYYYVTLPTRVISDFVHSLRENASLPSTC